MTQQPTSVNRGKRGVQITLKPALVAEILLLAGVPERQVIELTDVGKTWVGEIAKEIGIRGKLPLGRPKKTPPVTISASQGEQ